MTNGKLIMMKGLPRSGKSTWAREFQKKSGNVVIVSRDNLRWMLHGEGRWSPRLEGITVDVQKAIVRDLLQRGRTVIIDDTNLFQAHRDRWESLAKECNSNFEVHVVLESNIQTLINRDNSSKNKRGKDVIISMALESQRVSFEKKSIVICDLDGTLCNIQHRLHFVKGVEKKDWKSFFEYIPGDTLNQEVYDMLRKHHDAGRTIFFVSGRSEEHRSVSERWLFENGFVNKFHDEFSGKVKYNKLIPYFGLIMRRAHDKRQDDLIKEEILLKCFDISWIHEVIDDRKRVIDMWTKHGLSVVNVGGDDNDF